MGLNLFTIPFIYDIILYMQWLEDRLYETERIQNNWSVEEWRSFWAQLMKTVQEAVSNITQEMVDNCSDERQKSRYNFVLQRKYNAEKQVQSWDLSKMSYKVKLLIKAELMQQSKYRYGLKHFENLQTLENINRPNIPFDISLGNRPSLKWYYNMNILV